MSAPTQNDLVKHLGSPITVVDLIEDKEDKKQESKKRNLNLTAGISNNGFNLEMMRKNILKQGDFAKLAFNQNQEHMRTYSFSFMQPYFLPTKKLP